MKMLKYPKFTVLALTFIAAYVMFSARSLEPFHESLLSLGYLGTFIAGVFYAYGFTGAPAAAVLLILAQEQNVLIAGFIAGLGALLADISIFNLIRHSFRDEIDMLAKERAMAGISRRVPVFVRKHIVTFLAFFFIASPLPDEIGVSMLACEKWISARKFSILCYALNTAGIFVILAIGTLL